MVEQVRNRESGDAQLPRAGLRFAASAALLLLMAVEPSGGFTSASFPSQSSDAAKEPQALNVVRELLREGDFEEAEKRARDLLKETETVTGPDSLEAALIMDLVVEALWKSGRVRESGARELAERALAIKEDRFGPVHREVAISLRNLANVFEGINEPSQAKTHYERIVGIQSQLHGPKSTQVADALVDLGSLALVNAAYEESQDFYQRALSIQERTLGEDHPDVSLTLNNLANVLHRTGDYDASESHYRRALAIKEAIYGKHDPELGWTLNGLGVLLKEIGAYSEARSSFETALDIWETAYGPDHTYVSWVLNNLAGVERAVGNYAEGLALYDRTLEIATTKLGTSHLDVAKINHNRARLLGEMGNFGEARRLYEEALAIRSKSERPDHPGTALTLRMLAALLLKMGDPAEAESLYNQAVQIYEKSLGTDHADYSECLTGLAHLQGSSGRVGEARRLYAQAVAIQEEALGDQHPTLAETLNDFADFLSRTGNSGAATSAYERAMAIRDGSLGPDHPLAGKVRDDLGRHLAGLGEYSRALELALLAEEIGRDHLRLTARTLTERRALSYSVVRSSGLDLALSIAAVAGDRVPGVARRIWGALIQSRAIVLDEMAFRRRSIAGSADPEVAAAMEDLAEASRRLANVLFRGPSRKHPERHLGLLEHARRKKEEAERTLAEKSLAFREERAIERIDLTRVAAHLSPGDALVAFVRFHRYPVPAVGESARGLVGDGTPPGNGGTGVAAYAAFVQRAVERSPSLVFLGEAEGIDSLIAGWQKEMRRTRGQAPSAPAEAAYRAVASELRRKIWDPLFPLLRGVGRVFLVPDGAMHLVSFAALPEGDSEYLLETGPLIHYLSAERDIARARGKAGRGTGLLAMGGPAYDVAASPAQIGASRVSPGAGVRASPYRGSRSSCGVFHRIRFEALPSAAKETEELVAMWREATRGMEVAEGASSVVHLKGFEASEAAFKESASGRRVLHLATHGFFLGADCPSISVDSRGIGIVGPRKAAETSSIQVIGENPLLLSGLALAGANRRASAGQNDEDGILTAEEIAAMDLKGVEWAVLSACDTGVGAVKAGEGVLGLRRAFEVAGADTVIMTLWPVSDETAREWMRELYIGRLLRRLDTAEAVRKASMALLQREREKHGAGHPFYWAGFIAAGDWR